MNKKRLHHYGVVLKRLKTWQLLVIALILSAVGVGLLRSNSLEAVRLFNAVKQADESGGDVYGALNKLQKYVTTHMNTQLERVSLEKTFERAYQAELDRLASSGSIHDDQYDEAQAACRDQNRVSYVAYSLCVERKLAEVAPGENPLVSNNLPKTELYQYTFVSPGFSFDLAGFSVAITAALYLVIVVKVGASLVLYLIVRKKHVE